MFVDKNINKQEALDLIGNLKEEKQIMLFSDSYWPYPLDLPTQLRDAKNSIMLDVMIQIEKRSGILLYIPLEEYEKLKNGGKK